MTGPARNLVALLRSAGPLTLGELAERLQYAPAKVLGFIAEARADGAKIVAIRDASVTGVPARAQPEAGAWTTVYTVKP